MTKRGASADGTACTGPLDELRRGLAARGVRPSKALGQNFMVDPGMARAVARASGAAAGEVVLEVGPGAGHLTSALVEFGSRVVAVEIDPRLAELARERLAGGGPGALRLVVGDVLSRDGDIAQVARAALDEELAASGRTTFRVASNLPYSAAATFLVSLAGSELPWSGGAVVIQREVAERLASPPGRRTYGASSVLWQLAAVARLERRVAPSVFWPRPEVDSSLVRVEPRPEGHPELTGPAFDEFAYFVRGLFSARRKMLRSAVASAAALSVGGFRSEAKALAERACAGAGIEPSERPEDVDPEGILRLWRAVRETR